MLGTPAARADASRAEKLFQEGRAALDKGDYEAACSKLRSSFEISDALGPLLNLADCEEKRGRLVAALELWQKGAVRLAEKPRDERGPIAKQHITELEGRIPRLALSLAPGAPAGIRVRVDGAEVEGLPREMPLDPGTHEVIISAKGHEEKRSTITLDPSEREPFQVAPGRPRTDEPGGESGSGRRTAGIVVGGVGLAGLVAFGVTGGLMLGKQAVVDEHCDAGSRTCDATGFDAAASGRTLGIVNGAVLGVGLAGVAVGTLLIVTGGGEKKTASVGIRALPGGSMLSLGGRF